MNDRRRQVMLGAVALAVQPALASQLIPTPRQTPGPFYPAERPLEDDSDLTRVGGRSAVAQGRITDLSGRLLDPDGRPVVNARVEIWQCDALGFYHHPNDRAGARDPGFQGFGASVTDGEGRYRFRTIRPVAYPGRTPHIHFAVFVPGASPFVTQLYVAGEPRNQRDFLFKAIPTERRRLVLAEFLPTRGSRAELAAGFDIVLGRDGTPAA
jgi:protocatechuate 3,4-dioxygenase, beta subunit